MTDSQQTNTRTLGQAVSDVRYAVHYATRNEAWWRRFDSVLNFVGAIAGTATFGSLFSQNSAWGPWAAGLVALASVAALVTKPMDKAIGFRDFRRKFADLDAVAWTLSLHDLDARLRVLRQEAPLGFGSLEPAAWNDMVMADGHLTRVRKLGRFERFMAWMA